jgi:hypothetical protein
MELTAKDYRSRENWLYFPGLPLDPIQIPFGVAVDATSRPRLKLRSQGRQVTSLYLQTTDSWRQVLPAFSRRIAAAAAGLSFNVEVAIEDWQRSAARGLVARSHYLSPRATGLILVARVEDATVAKGLRLQWWRKLPPETQARLGGSLQLATGGLSNVVGALNLERLMHGLPRGRDAIYAREGRTPPKLPAKSQLEGFRQRVVDDLGVYWISRVAVDAPFQRLGVGSVLCDAAREVAALWMPRPGRYVELIRRLSHPQFVKISGGQADFLTGFSNSFSVKLPYALYPERLSRRPGQVWNDLKGRSELVLPSPQMPRPAGDCLAYYHAKAGRMIIHGF